MWIAEQIIFYATSTNEGHFTSWKKNKSSCQIVWVLLHPLDVIFKIVSDTVTTELQAEMNTVYKERQAETVLRF